MTSVSGDDSRDSKTRYPTYDKGLGYPVRSDNRHEEYFAPTCDAIYEYQWIIESLAWGKRSGNIDVYTRKALVRVWELDYIFSTSK